MRFINQFHRYSVHVPKCLYSVYIYAAAGPPRGGGLEGAGQSLFISARPVCPKFCPQRLMTSDETD